MKEKFSKEYLFVIISMCGLAGASVGIMFNSAGVFYAPVSESLSIGSGAVSLTTTIGAIIASFAGLLVPKVLKTENFRTLIIVSMFLCVGGTALLAFAGNLFLLYLLNAVRGFGAGLTNFILCTFVINNWFYAKHGLVTSITLSFSGLPGIFLSPFFASVIASQGWRSAYIVVAVIMAVFMAPSILLPISLRPETLGLKPYGYETFLRMKEADTERPEPGRKDFNYGSLLYVLAVVYTLLSCVLAGVMHHFASYAVAIGLGTGIGAMMLSLTNASNISGKLLFGFISDRIGAKKGIILLAACSLTGLLLITFVQQPWAALAGALLFGLTMSNSAVGLVMITRDAFGVENYNRAYPMLAFLGSLSNAIAIAAFGFLYDLTESYPLMFILCAIFQLLLILTVLKIYSSAKKNA